MSGSVRRTAASMCVGDALALDDGLAGRDGDDGIGEVVAAGLAHP